MPDIRIVQGDTFVFDVFATRYDAVTGLDVPVPDIEKVWFTVKRNKRDLDSDAILKHDSTDSSQQVRIVNLEGGQIRIKIMPSDTVNLPASYYPYDVKVRESDSDHTVSTVEKGYIELSRASTLVTT